MKTAFVLHRKTRQIRELGRYLAELHRKLKIEKERWEKITRRQDDVHDEMKCHYSFLAGHIRSHISWLEAEILSFERQMDKLVAQALENADLTMHPYADKVLAKKMTIETGIDNSPLI